MEPKNELDKIFKEGLEHAQFEAPPGVWESISSSVSSSATQVFWTATAKWVAGITIGATTLAVAVGLWMSSPQNAGEPKPADKALLTSPNGAYENKGDLERGVVGEAEPAEQNKNLNENGNSKSGQIPQEKIADAGTQPSEVLGAGDEKDVHAKSQSTKQQISKPQAVPTHITSGQKAGFDCSGSLKIQAEKISNTAWSFQAVSSAGSIEWYFGDGIKDYGLMSSHEYSDRPAQYNVTAYSIAANGCRDSAKLKVKVEGVKPVLANIFTPDGDGFNDGYYVEVPYAEFYDLKIYDKQNRLVFQTNDPNQRWDGTCREMPCPAGKYRVTFNYKYPGDEKTTTATQILALSRKQN